MPESFKSMVQPVLAPREYEDFCNAFDWAQKENLAQDILIEAESPSDVILASFPWSLSPWPEGCEDPHAHWQRIWDKLLTNELTEV